MIPEQVKERDNFELFDLARVFWWLGLTPFSYYMGWLDKVTFVSLLSIWALVESAWGARQSSALRAKIDSLDRKLDLLLGSRLD